MITRDMVDDFVRAPLAERPGDPKIVGFAWTGRSLWLGDRIIGWIGPTYAGDRSSDVVGYHAYFLPPEGSGRFLVDRISLEGAQSMLEQEARRAEITHGRSTGETLREIGTRLNITRQRVHQLIKKEKGGSHAQ